MFWHQLRGDIGGRLESTGRYGGANLFATSGGRWHSLVSVLGVGRESIFFVVGANRKEISATTRDSLFSVIYPVSFLRDSALVLGLKRPFLISTFNYGVVMPPYKGLGAEKIADLLQ